MRLADLQGRVFVLFGVYMCVSMWVAEDQLTSVFPASGVELSDVGRF